MNKGIVFYGINKTKIVSKRIPQCKKGHAIIKVKCAGICGTDLIILNGQHARANPGCILGHEFSGVIHKREGSERKDYKQGNRVVINPVYSCGECDLCKSGNYHICENKGLYGIDQNGGFTQYSRVPLTNLYKIPDSISFEEAALTEPLAVAIRAVSLSKIRIGQSAIIIGGGPIGLLIAITARFVGIQDVKIIEINDFRIKMAKQMGYKIFTPNTLPSSYNRNFDVVFDAAGSEIAAELSTGLVRRGGTVIIVAVYKKNVYYNLSSVAYGELRIKGSCLYTPRDFRSAINLIEIKKDDINMLISHRYPLKDHIKAFELLKNSGSVQKVVFNVS